MGRGGTEETGVARHQAGDERRFRCPGCDRVIDGSGLAAGEPFKCAKCKKLLRFGPHLWDAAAAARWRAVRVAVLLGCMAATVWCVMTGYELGARTGQWAVGFGGALGAWVVAALCIALAALTAQNNGVVVGVTGVMSAVLLVFVERLGRHVGYDVAAWERYRFYQWWLPVLLVVGGAVLAASLVVQARRRSL